MDKFEQYKINISEKDKTLVLEYLEKIKKFVGENKIDKELYNDIEEMVFEKLSLEKSLDQLKVVKILKEVGEPEIIFSDYVDTKKTSTKNEEKVLIEENFYEKLIENGWTRDNENAIFLGISKTLSEKIGVSIWAIRILLIILFFFGGISAWLYILAGIILPVKGEKYGSLGNFAYFRTQLILVIRNGVYNLSLSFSQIVRFIFSNLIMILKTIFSFIVNNIFPIIRFFVFLLIAFGFASVLFILMTGGAMYFSGFSIDNVDFTGVLPPYYIGGIFFGILSSAILTIASLLYGLNKKIISSYILSLAGLSFLVALFLGISTGFDLFKKYSSTAEFVQETNIENIGTGELLIDLGNLKKRDFMGNFSNISSIKLENSPSNNLELKVINKIYGNEEISKKVEEGFSKIYLEKNGNNVSVKLENNKIFSKKVPFTFMERELVLYVPKEVIFSVTPEYSYYFENVFLDSKYEKYNDFMRNNCMGAKIFFTETEQKFVCEANDEELKYAKEEYFKKYVMDNFENITTIKHKNKYKRDYYSDYGMKNDWNFDNFYFENDKTLNVEFSDMSLNIDADLNIEETNSGVFISNFKINDVENNEYFKEKYYEDISSIKDFLIIDGDDEF